METYESRYAIFNYNESDKVLVQELSKYLDDNAINIIEYFEIEPSILKKVEINIIPTKKEFDELYKKTHKLSIDKKVPNWIVGFSGKKITYLSLFDYKNTVHAFKQEEYENKLKYYKKTIVHEYVHFINMLFNKKMDCNFTSKYLIEGIACYLSHQYDDKEKIIKSSLDDIINCKNCTYVEFYTLTDYLINNYSKDKVFELLQSSEKANVFLKEELYDRTIESITDGLDL